LDCLELFVELFFFDSVRCPCDGFSASNGQRFHLRSSDDPQNGFDKTPFRFSTAGDGIYLTFLYIETLINVTECRFNDLYLREIRNHVK
jgi:hypothetical protein